MVFFSFLYSFVSSLISLLALLSSLTSLSPPHFPFLFVPFSFPLSLPLFSPSFPVSPSSILAPSLPLGPSLFGGSPSQGPSLSRCAISLHHFFLTPPPLSHFFVLPAASVWRARSGSPAASAAAVIYSPHPAESDAEPSPGTDFSQKGFCELNDANYRVREAPLEEGRRAGPSARVEGRGRGPASPEPLVPAFAFPWELSRLS